MKESKMDEDKRTYLDWGTAIKYKYSPAENINRAKNTLIRFNIRNCFFSDNDKCWYLELLNFLRKDLSMFNCNQTIFLYLELMTEYTTIFLVFNTNIIHFVLKCDSGCFTPFQIL